MAKYWDIQLRGSACLDCGKPFLDQQRYHSLLIFSEEGYVRKDYCEACSLGRSDNRESYSAWKGVFRFPPPPKEEALKKETAESLFRTLIEDDDDIHLNVIFILAVMLERKRILVERDVQDRQDGLLTRVYEHRKSGELFLITDPDLDLKALEDIQEEIVVLLEGIKRTGMDEDLSPDSIKTPVKMERQ